MRNHRIALLAVIALLLVPWTAVAWADEADIKLAGFADVPGSTLTLPLAPGSPPVTINITFGIPSVTIPVQVTTSTRIKSDLGLLVTLTDGDRIKLKARVAGSALVASKLEVETFPELEVIGTATGLPAGGVMLPLPPGTTVDFVLSLTSGITVPVRLTDHTKVEDSPRTIRNGDTVQVEAVVRDNMIVATEIGGERKENDD